MNKVMAQDRQNLLMQAFGFTDADLKANQEGLLSLNQVHLVRQHQIRGGLFLSGIGLLSLFPTILLIMPILHRMMPDGMMISNPILLVLIFLIGLCMVAMIIIVMGIRQIVSARRITQKMKISRVHGLAVIYQTSQAVPQLIIDNVKFRLTSYQLAHIKALELHTIYCMPRSKRILSIKAL